MPPSSLDLAITCSPWPPRGQTRTGTLTKIGCGSQAGPCAATGGRSPQLQPSDTGHLPPPPNPGWATPDPSRGRLPPSRTGRTYERHRYIGEIIRRSVATASETSVMILPQVHLRKPCYDFYFL